MYLSEVCMIMTNLLGKCNLVSENVPFYYNLISSSRLRLIVNRLHLVCGCNEHFLQASKIEQC